MDNPFGGHKLTRGMVLKLTTIITSKNCNFCIKLRSYGVIEVLKDRGDLEFIVDKKDLVRRV